jgi:hypothetical protein
MLTVHEIMVRRAAHLRGIVAEYERRYDLAESVAELDRCDLACEVVEDELAGLEEELEIIEAVVGRADLS